MNLIKRIELIAVAFSLLFTILFTYGYIICYLFAFLSASIYLILCFNKRIYAESLLQLFYIFTAFYGFLHWSDTGGEISPSLSTAYHASILGSGLILTALSGALLKRLTNAERPFVDSFTTVFSIFATLLMINLIPENWWYWIVIDLVSIWLYYKRGLYFTAVLFFLYAILAINGLFEWQMF